MGGGGGSTAEKYAKFGAGEYSSSDFERYVDSRPDLAAAWRKIESDPTAWDSKYWIDKGATSKAAFGRAHAAEDAALYAGTYGDSGDTKVLPGTPEYEAYFGDSGGTSFDSFISSPSASVESSGGGLSVPSRPSVASSPVPSNPYYPQLVQEYEAPSLIDYSAYMPADSLFGYEQYQPWTNPNSIDSSIFNYQPPTIYATDPRISLGGLARTSGVGGRIMPTRPMGGGEFGIEGGSSSDAASDAATGTFDADDYVIPGTNTTAQSLFDYEAGDMSNIIRDQEGNIERKYYVNPALRQDLVAQDIEKARQDAYIKNAAPLVTTIGQIELAPAEAVKRYNSGHLPDILADQVAADIARVAEEIKFRPRSREEASQGPTGARPSGSGVNRGHPSGDASFGGRGTTGDSEGHSRL